MAAYFSVDVMSIIEWGFFPLWERKATLMFVNA